MVTKPPAYQSAPATPNFDKEALAAVEYDGVPPLAIETRTTGVVVFSNVTAVWRKDSKGSLEAMFPSSSSWKGGVAVMEGGQLVCAGDPSFCATYFGRGVVVDLEGGTISPGLTSYGALLGLEGIAIDEPSTNDGTVYDIVGDAHLPSALRGLVVKASDGLLFGGRDELWVAIIFYDRRYLG